MDPGSFLSGIPGPQRILKALTGGLGISSSSGLNGQMTESTTHQTCSKEELSCHTRYSGQDTCCFNHPGGQMLQTQFWDADPAVGPDDSWIIHGLWWASFLISSFFAFVPRLLQGTRYPWHEMLTMNALLGRTIATVVSISSVTPRGIITTYP